MTEETNFVQKKHKLLDHPILTSVVLILIKMALVNLLGYLRIYIIDWNPEDPIIMELISTLTSVVPTIALALIVKYRLRDDFRLGFNGKHLGQSLILFLMLLLPQILSAGISVITYNGSVAPTIFLIALIFGFGPGISEELLSRSLMLGNMERCWRGRKDIIYRTVLLSALVFGLMHLVNIIYALSNGLNMANVIPQVLNQVIYNFGFAIFYGAVYMRTHNIWGPIIVHSLFDAASDIITATGEAESTNAVASIISANFSWINLIVTLVILIVYGGIGLFLIRPKKHEEILSRWTAAETDR